MDPLLYQALKQINKHGKVPDALLSDRLQIKIGLIELKYIEQRPTGFYRLNSHGKRAFKRARWNRIAKWWQQFPKSLFRTNAC